MPATASAPRASSSAIDDSGRTGESGGPGSGPAKAAFRTSLLGTVLPMLAGIGLAAWTDGGEAETLAFAGLFWGGALVGPSLGYARGGVMGSALPGLILRVGLFTITWAIAPTRDFDDGILPNPEINLGKNGGSDDLGLWVLSTAVILASGIIDIVRVADRVHEEETGSLHLEPRDGGVALTMRVGF